MGTENQEAQKPEAKPAEDSAKELETLRAEILNLTRDRDNAKTKARDYEQAAKQAEQWKSELETATVEKSNIFAQLTNLQNQIKDKEVSTHLTTALEAAGARSVEGALKLVDRSKIEFGEDGSVNVESVAALVNAVKTADPWAFKEAEVDPKKGPSSNGTGQPPSVKDVAQHDLKGAYDTEIKAAKSIKEIEAVMKKYGKI